ncbi:glycosyltransferase CAZy family GT77 [Chlorella sorokiniana]|uniref:Glycosyltransferase n=1 Tax=Chlorella sorokiniana TaxID=3076 RepID=A0A2P6TVG5_CHLSO|nr:glycosyltransferase CAZy family GT77 [Chlorella sorokiniana]|eukprot:PRW58051.1 glycosyltransferase CAZy family GT77 [Chlorella sorokiniana]
MAPMLRGGKAAPTRQGPVALAMVAGVAAGLLVASWVFAGSHHTALANGSSSGGGVGGGTVVPITTAGTGAVASLQAEVQKLLQERDAAQQEVAKLRAQVTSGSAAGTAAAGTCPDRHTPWGPTVDRDKQYPELAEFLKKVAINNEVLVAVSNKNYAWPGGMLSVWAENAKRAGVKNMMVVALDEDTKTNAEGFGLPAFRMDIAIPDSQKNAGSNHAVSALKFRILQNFIKLGYSVFLSDVDIIFLQNPFEHLHRDSDVEGMTDGWDNGTAYGYNDVADDASMGWARYAHSMRVFVLNSGLFYIRPTQATTDLLDKLIYRVETENGWDQALFNECIFFPSRPGYKDPSVTRRVLDYMLFMNSKVLFKHLRHDKPRFDSHMPVSVHVNYHPDKFERMKAVVKRYVDKDLTALDRFPDGSE